MALRADTARHIITGATVLIFSAAAIGTAMRYQDRGPLTQLPSAAELPAREASTAAAVPGSAPAAYRDGTRGAGSDISARLEGTLAAGSDGSWAGFRDGGRAANAGSARWWADTSARMTPTARRSRGVGSASMPGSGYAVSGGARGDRPAPANAAPADRTSGSRRSNGGGSGGSSPAPSAPPAADPVFDDHTPSVGDLIDEPVEGVGDGVDNPGGGGGGTGLDPGGLAHSPEPASLLLMATGVAGVLGVARRRRNARRR